MGMFDYIKCEMPLPETEVPPPLDKDMFQTKDTPDQYLTVYTITSDGRLTWRPYQMVAVPKAERPHPNEDGLLGMMGSMRRDEGEAETIPFHGDIHFGTISTHHGRYSGGDWEYRARFTDGICAKIDLIEFSKPDPERIAEIDNERLERSAAP